MFTVALPFLSCILAEYDLEKGANCDEIRERRYCAASLVCHRCAMEEGYTCVKCKSVYNIMYNFLKS